MMKKTLDEFKKEILFMVKLRHPNILLFMGACTSRGNLAIITELMSRGSIYDLLHNSKEKLSFQTRMLFAKDTALGMNWLHCNNPPFLHLDLKTQNLLVNDDWTVKVADFGLTQIKKQIQGKGKAGSPIYMAPEILLDKGFDEKSDVYSFGIVLWELFTVEEPYKGKFTNLEDLVESIAKKGIRPELPKDIPSKMKQLIQSCWNPEPKNRPTFSQILNTKVIDEIIIEGLISEVNYLGRELWKENFLEKSQVLWNDFLNSLLKKINYSESNIEENIHIESLKLLIVKMDQSKNEIVTLENFAKILEWFGPIKKGDEFLHNITHLLKMKGFFGAIESKDAENLIGARKTKGDYLIRFSNSEPGSFTITSYSKQGQVTHYRISHKAGSSYELLNKQFSSLEQLIRDIKKELFLKNPLSGSPFENFFLTYEKKLNIKGYS
jgi:serine/threonine protein kinase